MRIERSDRSRRAASLLALNTRHHPSDDRSELVRELNAARAEDWARTVAAAAPPLTDEQRAKIARIILGG
jgi:hypothetical protein